MPSPRYPPLGAPFHWPIGPRCGGGIGPTQPLAYLTGGGGLMAGRRRQRLIRHDVNMMRISPPTAHATAITTFLWSSIQERISPPTEEPLHCPLSHLPPPPQGVPSRKFWFRAAQALDCMLDEAHVRVHEELSHAYVSLVLRRLPMRVRHW